MNHVDISPNWAGILMGITNTFANLTGFAAPYVAGLLINDDVSLNGSLIKVGKNSLCGIMSVCICFFFVFQPSIQNWQYVFFIAAGIYFFDVIIYVIFASGEEQSWNRPKKGDSHQQNHHQLEEIKQVVTAP